MFILVARNNANKKAVEASLLLSAYLDSMNIDSAFIDSSALFKGATLADCNLHEQDIDMSVVLGGDGTILHIARLLAGEKIPILGINFGNLGFLANDGDDDVIGLVSSALAGELKESIRSNLDIEIYCEFDDGKVPQEGFKVCQEGKESYLKSRSFALNEIALTRGDIGRSIDCAVDVSGINITDISGDGVIIATSTGSTAYSLAAGGPIVDPAFTGMIVQPLAPQTLDARTIMTGPQDIVTIDLTGTRDGRCASLFADGDSIRLPSKAIKVVVRRGSVPTRLLYKDGAHFYKYCSQTFFKG